MIACHRLYLYHMLVATVYELQVYRAVVRFCHLRGGGWGSIFQPSRWTFSWEDGE